MGLMELRRMMMESGPHEIPQYETSGPADVVTFESNWAMPMRSLKVGIDPVQDLHGYENPWPAGGGVNKFDGLWNGATSSNNYATNYIPVTAGESYFVVTPNLTSDYVYVEWYDSEKVVLSQSYARNSTVIAPTGAVFARLKLWYTFDTTDIAFNYPATATAYSPYSNICPISGWTGAQAQRTGKNLIDLNLNNLESGSIAGANGSNESTMTRVRTKNMYPFPFDSIYDGNYVLTIPDGYKIAMRFYDKDGSFVAMANNQVGFITGLPSSIYGKGAKYVRFIFAKTDNSNVTPSEISEVKYQLELGNTYPISWETEVGTIYGGTLDVVSGELVVDRVAKTFASSAGFGYECGFLDFGVNIRKTSEYPLISNELEYSTKGFTSLENNRITNIGGLATYAFAKVEGTTDKASFDAWLSENLLQVVAYIATPQTYHLTPTEVRTLLGTNNVWADTGQVEVQYWVKD